MVPNPKGKTAHPEKRSPSVEKNDKHTPPAGETKESEERDSEKIPSEDELDFALAFVDTDASVSESRSEKPIISEESSTARQKCTVPRRIVRVALNRNCSRLAVYSIGKVDIHAYKKYGNRTCRGRIGLRSGKKKNGQPRAVVETSEHGTFAVFLPCTLQSQSAHAYFELDQKSYRGGIIIIPGRGISFSVVNFCPVEEYLRGVVPLEIGKRSDEDLEAIKAQAVAARTYTYKKMIERQQQPFDLLATVEDQVYGGVTTEYPLSDRAIKMTEDMVAVYGDSLIYAYYHSTCGGMTANITDVWQKPPQPYLRSIRDVDKSGKAYCAISRYFIWRETWNTATLSSIAKRYSSAAFPAKPAFRGAITGITVLGTFPCGRISACRINTSEGEFIYSGDKIRFLLRRNEPGHPILRSACFTVAHCDKKKVTLSGQGYGHGVGMCQMGAIGRARAGQTYIQILKAYYSGINIVPVVIDQKGKKLVYE